MKIGIGLIGSSAMGRKQKRKQKSPVLACAKL